MTASTADTASADPIVSVVIPAYNCGRFIRDALDSVFAQEYPALEVFVIDDGSTDNTCEVVAGYGSRVNLIRQKNAGAAAARNEGISRARGEYIALLDADDIWLPGKLRHQVAHLERSPGVAMCCAKWELLHPDAKGEYHFDPKPAPAAIGIDAENSGWIYCQLLLDCGVWTSTVLMRRDLAERIGGFERALSRGQDYDYWLRASRLTRIDRLDAPLALYRIEVGSEVRKFPNTNWELAVISGALGRWGGSGPDGQSLPPSAVQNRLWALNYGFAYAQYHNGRYPQARASFLAAWRLRPAHAKTLFYLLASSIR